MCAPAAVRVWLAARAVDDFELVKGSLTEDVVVAAGGRLFEGRAAVLDWSRRATTPGRAVLTARCVTRADATLVTLRVEGQVPRHYEEVTYCFLVRGDLIGGLVVAA